MNEQNLSIELIPRLTGGSYKSLSSLIWRDIPNFSIITGKNGSGKTQLLRLLAYQLTETRPSEFNDMRDFPLRVIFKGRQFRPEEVGYVPSEGRFSGHGSASLSDMLNMRRGTLQQADSIHSYWHDPAQKAKAALMNTLLAGKRSDSLSDAELDQIFPDDYRYLLADLDATAGLAFVFVAHRHKKIEALERGTPNVGLDGKPLGPAPWDVVNESLASAGFPYEVISPENTKLVEPYVLKLRDKTSGSEIIANDLSSGEKTLLQLVLWLFSSSKNGGFPKLLLLDEPDAHLHPSMTSEFLYVISDILVNKYGVMVIMTTHSPSTVALAPEGSVFQLERGGNEVTLVSRREDILAVLTAGLVTVSRSSKYCFVEDEKDVDFYNAIRDILSDYGPSRDPCALGTYPSLAFIPASLGKGQEKIPGGVSVASKWVERLDAAPLQSTFLAIVDKDNGNISGPRIKVIGRYSFENYLLDPLNIFGLLLEIGEAPHIEGLEISRGDEHLIRAQPDKILQAVADAITSRMESVQAALRGTTKITVSYTVGRDVMVPSWVVDYRGHDLLPIAQRAYGHPKVINPPRLIDVLRRVRLIPVELADILREIQLV